ncbi:D-alanyl-D-alanine carboxypeptidase/D-alanyl-D-alanine-endopeptidase [Brevibacillus invocatus]|uniref:D-alanyl-D-alanine carboxypeptidase/D-alanyl-D-alanine endopeptidase n=1 Tax=Brevibacillus invocatus TaxID=173959 RepID=UPI00203CC500|nr:D-alanyl-D-alanine carboxypeptidase/D-alanyl-D-alanine-endopeptidase [Brevibacillus invocatus]MCM3080934.1 D-alanyl-D-alanine carboxypeptidase/D-alanyl-D-alanine-endopeptidase [Brevibacillus invocatus]MCM3431213.1 D-alanyl-D-alanine carboxypeptidase/D-alanyl-D-alanine-endopeptidase [Brevibacillus invocatus]
MNLSFKRVCTWLLMLVMVLSVWTVPAHAQSGTIAAHSSLQANMEKYLSGLKLDENSMGLHAGIAIYDMTDQTYLYQHQANRSFIPASTLKLFTTITALDRLGPSYQWKTEVHVLGSMSADGAVNGNLVLKGYGDPTLTVDDLKGIAVALKQKGIKKVNGNLFVDESYFDSQRLGMGWMWDDEPYGYSAQLSGLAVEKNSVELTIAPGPAGAAVLNMQPATTMLKINNQITTVANSTERNITIDRPRGKNEMILTGTIGAQAKPYLQDVTMEDPALFVGELWKKELTAQGIAVQAQSSVKKTVVSKSSLLHTHLSKPLSEMIVELNKDSDNFYADMLLKTLGATQKGQGSFSAGSEVVSDMLQRAGVPEGYRVVDGSGLSRFNWITAEQMVTLLDFVQKQSYRDVLEASLPIAGVDGTLASRMKGTIAEKKAIAKTGSMGGVNALSGYVTAQNGHKLAYSIMTNGVYKSKYARDLQDFVVVLATTYPELGAPEGYIPEAPKTYLLSNQLDPILDQKEWENLTIGLVVKALDEPSESAVWYERDADTLLTPAANVKLLTGAAALQQLGTEHVFKTELYTDVAQSGDGTINGNLFVKGYGDPTIHTEDALKVQEGVSIEQIVEYLKEQQIQQITGNLILDESVFDQQRLGLGWTWDDENEAFNPRIGALSLNRGLVTLAYKPGEQIGDQVSVAIYPNTSFIEIKNEAKTVEAGSTAAIAIERDRATNQFTITGTLPLEHEGGAKQVPVEDPALYFGTVLKEKMESEGIRFSASSQIMIGTVPVTAVKWTEFTSLSLQEIVDYMSKNSDNNYAEMVLKSIGAAKKGTGSADSGIQAVLETVQTLGSKTNFDMVDGSGLTRYNLISPRHFVSVLEGLNKQPFGPVIEESMSLAGEDGTLEHRFLDTDAEGNLRGVTGALTDVSSLSGYVRTQNGEKLAFSLIINGYTPPGMDLNELEEQIVSILAAHE